MQHSNVGRIDRVLRIALGIALLSMVYLAAGPWRWAGLVGLLPLATGVAGWCPVYAWISRD